MKTKITLIQGDITQQDTDAIVNAANSSLMGGGGVDGAIHRAGGPEILAECQEIVAERGRCPTGEAVITGGGRLKSRYVIHTVGPVWRGGDGGEDELLGAAYGNSLQVAENTGVKTISFPSISTGAYRFPVDRAAGIAVRTVQECCGPGQFDEIRFVLFDESTLRAYQKAYDVIMSE